MPLSTIIYELDDHDRIQHIAPGWDRFARANAAPKLEAFRVLGGSIWLHVSGEAVRVGLELLFDSTRRNGYQRAIPFRCDSPSLRRFMTLELTPLARGYLRVTSRIEREESREVVSLLDVRAARAERTLPICGWCKQICLEDGAWHEAEVVVRRLGLFEGRVQPRVEQVLCNACEAGLQLAATL